MTADFSFDELSLIFRLLYNYRNSDVFFKIDIDEVNRLIYRISDMIGFSSTIITG